MGVKLRERKDVCCDCSKHKDNRSYSELDDTFHEVRVHGKGFCDSCKIIEKKVFGPHRSKVKHSFNYEDKSRFDFES